MVLNKVEQFINHRRRATSRVQDVFDIPVPVDDMTEQRVVRRERVFPKLVNSYFTDEVERRACVLIRENHLRTRMTKASADCFLIQCAHCGVVAFVMSVRRLVFSDTNTYGNPTSSENTYRS